MGKRLVVMFSAKTQRPVLASLAISCCRRPVPNQPTEKLVSKRLRLNNTSYETEGVAVRGQQGEARVAREFGRCGETRGTLGGDAS